MAEGILGGVLGEEEERPEVEGAESSVGAEAFAASIAAIASRQDPEVARETANFLKKQSHLLDLQAEHVEDEHALRMAHLRNQVKEENVRRLGLRLRVSLQLVLTMVAVLIGAGVVLMVRDAISSRRVIVDPFEVPPALATHGFTGKVVAGALLDELSRLQDATRTSSAARDLSGAWAGHINLEVPETGISVSEISRLLRERLGNDIHIEGDVVELPNGDVSLSVRGNGIPAKSFSGSKTEFEKITIAAAEYAYSKSQPGRWGNYLTETGRNAEAIAFAQSAIAGADLRSKLELLNTWGIAIQNTGGSEREALSLFRAELKLDPQSWVAYNNVINTLMVLGDEEGAWKAGEEMRQLAGGRPGKAPETMYVNVDYLMWNLNPWMEATKADAASNAAGGSSSTSSGVQIADIYWRMHDSDAAELAIKTTREDPNDPSIGAMTHFVRGRIAIDAGDAARGAAEMEAFASAYADPVVSSNYPGYNCWVAPAEEAAGRPEKADAVLKAEGTFLDCYRFRGDILDSRGDWVGAQKAYAEAVALAPDLPAGYYSWGVGLAKHGELEAAQGKLILANQKGPHWADPLKAWGDVLVKQGKPKDALAKYDEALKYAPNWKQLKEAREAAAQAKG